MLSAEFSLGSPGVVLLLSVTCPLLGVLHGLSADNVKPVIPDGDAAAAEWNYGGVNVKPSSIHPVTPPIIIFAGKPSRASRSAAALLAPLQCGPAQ
jgi:hypothetical protein